MSAVAPAPADAVVILVASDGGRVSLPRAVAAQASLLLRDMLDDNMQLFAAAAAESNTSCSGAMDEIPLDVLDTATLERCAVHMRYRYNNKMVELPRPLRGNLEDLVDSKDKEFLADWDDATAVCMVKASAFLNCPELHQLSCAKLASLLMQKSVEEIRITLGVQNDFSPEEEAALRKEHGMDL